MWAMLCPFSNRVSKSSPLGTDALVATAGEAPFDWDFRRIVPAATDAFALAGRLFFLRVFILRLFLNHRISSPDDPPPRATAERLVFAFN